MCKINFEHDLKTFYYGGAELTIRAIEDYLKGPEYLNMANVKTPLYDAHIMPKDLLTITVNTSDPDAPFPLI